MTEVTVNSREISGGSHVTVYKMFGNQYYFAIVETIGVYPKAGFWAENRNRSIYNLVLEGEVTFVINGVEHKLAKDQGIMTEDGDRFQILGKGRIMVFVNDGPGGATEDVAE